jgi:hypothetical protein
MSECWIFDARLMNGGEPLLVHLKEAQKRCVAPVFPWPSAVYADCRPPPAAGGEDAVVRRAVWADLVSIQLDVRLATLLCALNLLVGRQDWEANPCCLFDERLVIQATRACSAGWPPVKTYVRTPFDQTWVCLASLLECAKYLFALHLYDRVNALATGTSAGVFAGFFTRVDAPAFQHKLLEATPCNERHRCLCLGGSSVRDVAVYSLALKCGIVAAGPR